MVFDQETFQERTRHYLRRAAQAARSWYDPDGHWSSASRPPQTRERFWLSFALYAAGEDAFADAVIRQGNVQKSHMGIDRQTTTFDIFHTNIAVALLAQHRDTMAPDVRAKLEDLARDGFGFKPGNREMGYQFHGYNDNMPAKATMGLILGGEMLGNEAAVEHGLWNLRQMRAMLVRRGTNSEFNSPTYSPLTIHAMGEITAHARSAEAQDIARKIEERLWLDMAARFHPETGVLAGPYSRAYTMDTLAQVSAASGMLWFVLGENVHPSPMELFQPDPEMVVHHEGDYPFNIAQLCWFAAGQYHLPEATHDLFRRKSYPFRAVAMSEQGDAGPDFPARPVRLETVLQRDFTVGTSSGSFHTGEQTMSYFVTYKRQDPAQSFRDVGTIFHKMVVNEDVPGFVPPSSYANSGEQDNLASRCSSLTLQSDTAVLMLTHPHLSLGGPPEGEPGHASSAKPLTRLSEMVIFPSHFGGADEIWVGDAPHASWSGNVPHGAWIACRRGRLLVAVRPLCYAPSLGPVTTTLERLGPYEVIRSTFYQGEARTFQRAELRRVFGGFVAEHACTDDYASLAEFAQEVSRAQFTDFFWTTRRTRYRRPAGSEKPALEMEASWSPGSPVARFTSINGQLVPTPLLQITGVDLASVPFLDEPWQPIPGYFPWNTAEAAWPNVSWFVGDRGADESSSHEV